MVCFSYKSHIVDLYYLHASSLDNWTHFLFFFNKKLKAKLITYFCLFLKVTSFKNDFKGKDHTFTKIESKSEN